MASTDGFSTHEFTVDTEADPAGDPGPWTITSVVVSQELWNEFIDELKLRNKIKIYNANDGHRIDDVKLETIRSNKHIPMIARGSLTDFIFLRFGVNTKYMSVIVRGEGMRIMAERMSPVGQA